MVHRRLPRVEYLRRAARDKLMRAVDEVVGPYHARHSEQVAELRREVHELHDAVGRLKGALHEVEYRDRRDLHAAAERAAVASSAAFARSVMPTARIHPDMRATLAAGLELAGGPDAGGLALEFGVWSGTTLKLIAEARGGHDVYGFDSFEGLPEDWRSDFPAGTFPASSVPDVPGAELVIGWFADTLPGFLAEHDGPVDFVHVDCDLYSSTVTVLEHVGPRLRPGSVLVFDEYFNYPGWQDHEHRAWTEFVERTGLRFTYEGYTLDHEQVVVRVTGD